MPDVPMPIRWFLLPVALLLASGCQLFPGSREQPSAEAAPAPAAATTEAPAPDNAIEAVAIALRASVDEAALDTALDRLPVQAAGFWATPAR